MKKDCLTCKHDFPTVAAYCCECVGEPPSKWEPAEHYKPDTNADQIRAMSDEELAAAIWSAYDDNDRLGGRFCDGKAGCLLGNGDIDCNESKEKNCVIRWLQQPAKEETT